MDKQGKKIQNRHRIQLHLMIYSMNCTNRLGLFEMWKRSVECLLYILVRALETLDLMEPCFIMRSRSNLERLIKSNEDDDVLPILKISAEIDE